MVGCVQGVKMLSLVNTRCVRCCKVWCFLSGEPEKGKDGRNNPLKERKEHVGSCHSPGLNLCKRKCGEINC